MRIQNLIEISKSNADLPEGRKYPILYADPPWHYAPAKRADRLGGFTSGLVVHRLHRDGRDL